MLITEFYSLDLLIKSGTQAALHVSPPVPKDIILIEISFSGL
jgi:hypothetical protein